MTFGTIEDGNEDDAFADTKLMIMWGWNPAYTFHGGNTFYYMRLAKQRGCKFVVVDPQYTDSAAAYDAWWIPIRPNTDAAMLAGMAHYIFANNLQDQKFIDKFVQGMDPGTMPDWAKGQESFKDYIMGTSDGVAKTPEWAAKICGVPAADIIKLADMYATHQACRAQGVLGAGPQCLWRAIQPHGGRTAGDDRQHRHPRRLRRRRGQGLARRSVAYPYDENANLWWASIKSDRWAHCVLNYPNVKREEIGCWPRDDALDGKIPNIRASSGRAPTGSTSSPTSTRKSGDQEAGSGRLLGFHHHAVGPLGRRAAAGRHALRAARRRAALVQGALLHPPSRR
jgi:anaerobic dimethyl sulfoxide reductase subunit A